jgi:hypothetical protein
MDVFTLSPKRGDNAARPMDSGLRLRSFAKTEVDAKVVLRDIAAAASGLIHLL